MFICLVLEVYCQVRLIFPVSHFSVLTVKGINIASADVDVYITDIKFRQGNSTLPSFITDRSNGPAFLGRDSKTETLP